MPSVLDLSVVGLDTGCLLPSIIRHSESINVNIIVMLCRTILQNRLILMYRVDQESTLIILMRLNMCLYYFALTNQRMLLGLRSRHSGASHAFHYTETTIADPQAHLLNDHNHILPSGRNYLHVRTK